MKDLSTNARPPAWQRFVSLIKPTHSHTAFSATLLLMFSAFLSRIIGLVRVKYVSYLLGKSAAADAFNAAFQLPDMISYLLVGGAASITFVTMLTRYRDSGREAEGEHAMSVILTTMLCVLGAAVVVAELAAPLYVRLVLPGYESDPHKAALCVLLTRIVLPGQIFFLAGGVFGAVLISKKQFNIQAVTPLIYNTGIIVGGVMLSHYIGVSSLAVGALAGAFFGPFLLNAIFAHRAGMHYRPVLEFSNPGLHEWVKISIPLMLGFSLVTVDSWIINHFASNTGGAVSLLTYAKQLFTAPVALGQAAGIASLPFLATLWSKPDRAPFAASVNESVSRILAFSFLLSAWMISMANPAVDLVYRGGALHSSDTAEAAVYFSIFSVSLCFWSAQAIYARAFYATSDTVSPMVASTIVTVASLPIYWFMFHRFGAEGLAVASDIGIFIQTATFALMLHRRKMVSLGGLDGRELARSMGAAVLSLGVLIELRRLVIVHGRLQELLLLVAATIVWLLVSGAVLKLSGSALPEQLLGRLRRRRATA